jgi:hypothetical protein
VNIQVVPAVTLEALRPFLFVHIIREIPFEIYANDFFVMIAILFTPSGLELPCIFFGAFVSFSACHSQTTSSLDLFTIEDEDIRSFETPRTTQAATRPFTENLGFSATPSLRDVLRIFLLQCDVCLQVRDFCDIYSKPQLTQFYII